tara:strand:+ start:297 stop:1313 length:1017 start_codon:yes stop_codon:yes gene_type:complete
MKRLFSNVINLTLVFVVGLALSGCTVSNAAMGSSSPWVPLDLDTDANPLDVDFVDDKNGFLVGTDRLILETDDGGISWQERKLDIPSEGNFRLISVDFKDEEGWIAGQPGLILHTTDAGQNWTRIDLGNTLPGDPYLITTLGENSAELATTAGAIYKTLDGGTHWEAIVLDTSGSGGIREMRRTKNGGYISVSSLGNFFSVLSPDQENWSPHQRASSKRVQSVGEQPNGDLWMLSRGAEIRFNADSNDVDAWSKPIIPIVNGYNYQDLIWDPNESIWAAGGNGTLIVSNDDGKTWEQDPIGDDVPTNFIRILFVDSSNSGNPKGFVFGERGNLLRWQG